MKPRDPSPILVPALVLLAGCASSATPTPATTPATETPPPAEAQAAAPDPAAEASPQVEVFANQVGYFVDAQKVATVRSEVATPLPWTLRDASGTAVAQGQTVVFGADKASGEKLHQIDFTDVRSPGENYVLAVAEAETEPFTIAAGLYDDLAVDAMRFFYHQRSGVPIEMPFAGDPKWTRGAGHLSDTKVKCLPELECDYTLDVHGGWYDAGDHGKYVVNGGISVWTLLNLYERAASRGKEIPFADGTLNIPESGNGVNDLLDEVRHQMEFMLRMQVPKTAEQWAGMAFHKIHDLKWSGLPTNPATAGSDRYLHRPSTAATLNLAANAAQCARVWKSIDPAFSKRCLDAAKRAFTAAQKNPEMYAPASDHEGGGPYDDQKVSDEFYWAAVELYLTTGDTKYKKAAEESPHHLSLATDEQTTMTWQKVDALGTISLATVGKPFAQATIDQARSSLTQVADAYLANVDAEGYRVPMPLTSTQRYEWGSNSMILNNAIVLALAHDFTGDAKYRQGVVEAMDYLLGRNPNDISYVTGYGERSLQNPHHRFWAHQLDPKTPPPPPGIVSGGPNSSLQDPHAREVAKLTGCAPQKCFVDHIESWSTNEITINWNAPLAWVVSYL